MNAKTSFAARDWLAGILEHEGAVITGKGVMMVPPFTADIDCVIDGKRFIVEITPRAFEEGPPEPGPELPTVRGEE